MCACELSSFIHPINNRKKFPSTMLEDLIIFSVPLKKIIQNHCHMKRQSKSNQNNIRNKYYRGMSKS